MDEKRVQVSLQHSTAFSDVSSYLLRDFQFMSDRSPFLTHSRRTITRTVWLTAAFAAYLSMASAAERLAGGIPLSSLQLNGRAHYISNTQQILLTYDISEASSAFVPTAFTLGPNDSFSAEFVFDAAIEFTPPPADGLAFVAENTGAGPSYLGENGSGLGFFLGAPAPAIAATFDYYQNTITGTPPNVVAIALPQGIDLATAMPAFQLAGTKSDYRYAWVKYDNRSKVFAIFVSDTSAIPATPLVSTRLQTDLSTLFGGTVYFGITAGSGLDYAYQTLEYFNVEVTNRD